MSTVASSLNSLASASTHDFYAPLSGRSEPEHLLRVGRALTIVWAAVLVGGAMLLRKTDPQTPVVQMALSVASLTYGGLLGTYVLGGIWKRARERDVIVAIIASLLVMTPIVFARVLLKLLPDPDPGWLVVVSGLAWPWYVPLGTALTVVVGMISSTLRRTDAQAVTP
jgi:Na+/proline symporter